MLGWHSHLEKGERQARFCETDVDIEKGAWSCWLMGITHCW